jgi:antitoxin (DNA-binding transcriptional repressor) of toxin-antitoxin stability system
MPVYSIDEAKIRLSKLVDEALAGEDVTIARDDSAAVELKPRPARAPAHPYGEKEWRRLRMRRSARPSLGEDSVSIIRAMRDEQL